MFKSKVISIYYLKNIKNSNIKINYLDSLNQNKKLI